MGQFSWMYADTGNTESLKIGGKGYLICPGGEVLVEESYDGYGRFSGEDVYALIAAWNRIFIATHPEHENHSFHDTVQEFEWYPAYADLSIPLTKVGEEYELRCIGIDIACIDKDNASLPYPIKITKNDPRIGCAHTEDIYENLPPSDSDPNQGWHVNDAVKDSEINSAKEKLTEAFAAALEVERIKEELFSIIEDMNLPEEVEQEAIEMVNQYLTITNCGGIMTFQYDVTKDEIFEECIRKGFMEVIRSYFEQDENRIASFTGNVDGDIEDIDEYLEEFSLEELKWFCDAIDFEPDHEIIHGGWRIDGETFPKREDGESSFVDVPKNRETEPSEDLYINRVLNLSTGTLEEKEICYLTEIANQETSEDGLTVYKKSEYGFFVYFLDETGEYIPENEHPSLCAALRCAKEHRCSMICFDRDEVSTCGLPVYEW